MKKINILLSLLILFLPGIADESIIAASPKVITESGAFWRFLGSPACGLAKWTSDELGFTWLGKKIVSGGKDALGGLKSANISAKGAVSSACSGIKNVKVSTIDTGSSFIKGLWNNKIGIGLFFTLFFLPRVATFEFEGVFEIPVQGPGFWLLKKYLSNRYRNNWFCRAIGLQPVADTVPVVAPVHVVHAPVVPDTAFARRVLEAGIRASQNASWMVGWTAGRIAGRNADWLSGRAEGRAAGIDEGRLAGYQAGFHAGRNAQLGRR